MEEHRDKPPVGLRPRWVVQALRVQEILEAIARYNGARKPIPKEWSDELNDLFEAQRETGGCERKTDLGCRLTKGDLKFPL